MAGQEQLLEMPEVPTHPPGDGDEPPKAETAAVQKVRKKVAAVAQ